MAHVAPTPPMLVTPPARAISGFAPPSFESIYEQYVDVVWRSVLRLGVTEGAADDVVQNTFVVVHRQLGSFEGRSSIKTWIFAIALRVVQEHRRSLRRKSPHWTHPVAEDVLLQIPSAENPQAALESAEAWSVVESLLDSLDDEKRAVFVAAELEEMSAPEISDALGLSAQKVYTLLRAARTEFERAAARLRRRQARST